MVDKHRFFISQLEILRMAAVSDTYTSHTADDNLSFHFTFLS